MAKSIKARQAEGVKGTHATGKEVKSTDPPATGNEGGVNMVGKVLGQEGRGTRRVKAPRVGRRLQAWARSGSTGTIKGKEGSKNPNQSNRRRNRNLGKGKGYLQNQSPEGTGIKAKAGNAIQWHGEGLGNGAGEVGMECAGR